MLFSLLLFVIARNEVTKQSVSNRLPRFARNDGSFFGYSVARMELHAIRGFFDSSRIPHCLIRATRDRLFAAEAAPTVMVDKIWLA